MVELFRQKMLARDSFIEIVLEEEEEEEEEEEKEEKEISFLILIS
jgi:hypothetical protein